MEKRTEDLELKKLEIENLKAEIERLKLLANLSRTLAILLIPLVAGAISLIYMVYGKTEIVKQWLLIITVSLIITFSLFFGYINKEILKKDKKIKEAFKEL